MLVVNSYLDKSEVHGIGVFAGEDILPGTIIWQEGFEVIYTSEEFEKLPSEQKDFVRVWGWKDKKDGLHHLSLDHDRFMNHSENPNTKVEESGLTRASQFIPKGTEIVCNYAEFEAEFRFGQI